MTNSFLSIVFLSVISISSSFASVVASGITAQDQTSAGQCKDDRVVPRSGTIFLCDASMPVLGEAYKDPSGLIWGSPFMSDGKVKEMDQKNADKYCKSIGARLPTRNDAENFASFVYDKTYGYFPFLGDGKTYVLPDLFIGYWTSTSSPYDSDYAILASGSRGYTFATLRNELNPVRCVFGP